MSRIANMKPSEMSPRQAEVYDSIASGPRGKVEGPLNVWLKNPDLASRAQALGAYCRFHSSLSPRLSELIILVVGAHWASGFEWFIHAPIGREAGLRPEDIESIRIGTVPALSSPDEAVIYKFTTELLRDHRVREDTYAQAKAVLGESALVDLVGIAGYYTLICMTINAFEVEAPGGQDPFAGLEKGSETAGR